VSTVRACAFTCVTWPFHIRDMTHSHMWRDLFTYMTWLIHVPGMTHTLPDMAHSCMWCDLEGGVMAFSVNGMGVYMCDMTQSYMWYDASIYVTWFSFMCDMTWQRHRDGFQSQRYIHLHMWHTSIILVTWFVHTCDMTHPCMCIHVCIRIHIWKSVVVASSVNRICLYIWDMTQSCTWHYSSISLTWRNHWCDMTVKGRRSGF